MARKVKLPATVLHVYEESYFLFWSQWMMSIHVPDLKQSVIELPIRPQDARNLQDGDKIMAVFIEHDNGRLTASMIS